MNIKKDNIVGADTVMFLKHAYNFLCNIWPHHPREPIPDQGFEESFRSSCITKLASWRISQIREMHLGDEFETASGISHEIDLVGLHERTLTLTELKHWGTTSPTKNDVIVFFAKMFDYIAANSKIAMFEVSPVFLTIASLEESPLGTCLGLGIHPISPGLRPLPILIDSARLMENEIVNENVNREDLNHQLQELWTLLYNLTIPLEPFWVSSRCGFHSDSSILIHSTTCTEPTELARLLRFANAECSILLQKFRSAKKSKTV